MNTRMSPSTSTRGQSTKLLLPIPCTPNTHTLPPPSPHRQSTKLLLPIPCTPNTHTLPPLPSQAEYEVITPDSLHTKHTHPPPLPSQAEYEVITPDPLHTKHTHPPPSPHRQWGRHPLHLQYPPRHPHQQDSLHQPHLSHQPHSREFKATSSLSVLRTKPPVTRDPHPQPHPLI